MKDHYQTGYMEQVKHQNNKNPFINWAEDYCYNGDF